MWKSRKSYVRLLTLLALVAFVLYGEWRLAGEREKLAAACEGELVQEEALVLVPTLVVPLPVSTSASVCQVKDAR